MSKIKGIKFKPSKGYKYLKTLEVGSRFKTESGTEGILLEINSGSASVRITKVNIHRSDRFALDDKYYLGKKIIAPDTNVKQIKQKQ